MVELGLPHVVGVSLVIGSQRDVSVDTRYFGNIPVINTGYFLNIHVFNRDRFLCSWSSRYFDVSALHY